jgi:uncharacterized membrane protein
MLDPIVLVYPTEAKAEGVGQRLIELQNEHLIKLGDAVVPTKTKSGTVKLNRTKNITGASVVSIQLLDSSEPVQGPQRYRPIATALSLADRAC